MEMWSKVQSRYVLVMRSGVMCCNVLYRSCNVQSSFGKAK